MRRVSEQRPFSPALYLFDVWLEWHVGTWCSLWQCNDSQKDPGTRLSSVPPTLASPLGLWSLSGLNGTELLQELREMGHTASRWGSTGTAGAATSPLATQDVWLGAKAGADDFSLRCCSSVVLCKYGASSLGAENERGI